MNAEMKQKAKEIYGMSRNLTTTLQILVSDVRYAEEQLGKDKHHEQFWRRTIIRAVCALGEGTINVLKGMTPKTADFFGVALAEKEIAILNELQKPGADGKTKPLFLPIHKKLKETLKLFAKIHGVQIDIKFDQGYEDFCNTFNLRNRLMHPRKHFDLEVNDDDYKMSIRGWNWFNFTLVAALNVCGKKLPFSG